MVRKSIFAFFLGIGGSGMSALARLFQSQRCKVQGSDASLNTPICQSLRAQGIFLCGEDEPLPEGVQLLITSLAIPPDHPQLQEAKRRGVPCFTYPQMVGRLMGSRIGVSVCGTHGKTTTTALFATILQSAQKQPCYLVGGDVVGWETPAKWDHGRYFVVESCEYQRAFLELSPQHALVTNIDADHLDCYGTLEAIEAAFEAFFRKLPMGGVLVYNYDCPSSLRVVQRLGRPALGYSLNPDSQTQGVAKNVRYLRGGVQLDFYFQGKFQGTLTSRLLGEHNVSNIVGAATLASALKIPFEAMERGVASFRGAARRIQKIGEFRGVTLLDDYGHHPREIQATYQAVRQRYPKERLWLVFQPHQYSRTRYFFESFALALADWDQVILTDIYGARDSQKECSEVNAFQLAQTVRLLGGSCSYVPKFWQVANLLYRQCKPGDVVLTMGAGNVYEVGTLLQGLYLEGKRRSA